MTQHFIIMFLFVLEKKWIIALDRSFGAQSFFSKWLVES